MKLEVTHKEIVSGLTAFLASQGITGFDPSTCQVTFSTKRGTGELSAVLDTDPAPAEEAPAKPAAVAKPAAEAAPVAEAPKAEAAPKVEPEAATEAPASEVAAEPQVQTEEPEPALETAGAEEDNLFD